MSEPDQAVPSASVTAEPAKTSQPSANKPVGQAPVPGGLIGTAHVQPSGSEFKAFNPTSSSHGAETSERRGNER
jgi:hypothetical protein